MSRDLEELLHYGPTRADVIAYVDAISTPQDLTDPYLHLAKTIARMAFVAGWKALAKEIERLETKGGEAQ